MAVLLARRDAIGTLNDAGAWAIELEMLFALAGIAIYCLGAGKYSVSRGKGKWD
jgi:putative oxidoreductase